METTTDNQIAIIEKSSEVLKTGGSILIKNRERSAKAIEVGRSILKAIQEQGMTPALDERANNYLANVTKAIKEMKEGRAEVTQIMDALKKMFTEVENEMDCKKEGTVSSQIQKARDQYARDCAEAEKRKREEAEKVAAKQKEAIEIKNDFQIQLYNHFNTYVLNQKTKFTAKFNSLVLDGFADEAAAIRQYVPKYSEAHFASFAPFAPSWFLHTNDEIKAFTEEIKQGKFEEFSELYSTEMLSLKQDIVDKLPSKRAELLEQKRIADEAEAARVKAQKEEAERQAAMAKANAAQKAKLEEESRIAREAEAKRQAELKLQQEAAAKAQQEREQAEAARLQAEAAEAKHKAEQEAEIKKQGDLTMNLFEQEAAMSDTAPTPEARQGYDIEVTHQAGYVQIFQFWFENQGKNETIDKLEKTSLGQMKSFVEKHAHKQGRPNIESKFLIFNPSYKAVNRKAAQ